MTVVRSLCGGFTHFPPFPSPLPSFTLSLLPSSSHLITSLRNSTIAPAPLLPADVSSFFPCVNLPEIAKPNHPEEPSCGMDSAASSNLKSASNHPVRYDNVLFHKHVYFQQKPEEDVHALMPAQKQQRPCHRLRLGLLLVCLLDTSHAFFRPPTTTTLGGGCSVSSEFIRQQQRTMGRVALAVREGKEGDAK